MIHAYLKIGFALALWQSTPTLACRESLAALNTLAPSERYAPLAEAYRTWLAAAREVHALTQNEIEALTENPLVFPLGESGRAETREILDEIRRLHGELGEKEREPWLAEAKLAVRKATESKRSAEEPREQARQREQTVIAFPPAEPAAWFEPHSFSASPTLLSDGKSILEPKLIYVVGQGSASQINLEARSGYRLPLVLDPTQRFALENAETNTEANRWIDLNTGAVTKQTVLTQIDPEVFKTNTWLKFSPDGKWAIAQKKVGVLLVVDLTGNHLPPREVLGPYRPVAYSPSSENVLVTKMTPRGELNPKYSLLVVRSNGDPVEIINDIKDVKNSAVEANGNFLAVVDNVAGRGLYRIDAVSGAANKLRAMGSDAHEIGVLTPDGKYFVSFDVSRTNDFSARVFSMATGSPIASGTWTGSVPTQAHFDPKGKFLMLIRSNQWRTVGSAPAFPEPRWVHVYDFAAWLRAGRAVGPTP